MPSFAAFPPTHYSLIDALRSADAGERERALAVVAESYWRPIHSYVRLRWRLSAQDAEDAVQGFLAQAIAEGWLARYDATRARFRTYLRVCIDGHVSRLLAAAIARKRGGGAQVLSLDDDAAAPAGARVPDDRTESELDSMFEREWVRSLCEEALARLERSLASRGRSVVFEVFRRYDVLSAEGAARPTYVQLANALELPVTQVTNHLASARREFRTLLLERLRELTLTESEFRAEARALLGAEHA
jgi:DNA-directed RNA polymerase specialized sigma24 family protein